MLGRPSSGLTSSSSAPPPLSILPLLLLLLLSLQQAPTHAFILAGGAGGRQSRSRSMASSSAETAPPPTSLLPKIELYIIRHGESTGNRDGVLQGQSDYPLTETGRQQATAAGKRLASVHFDMAFSSDLSRARETAELIVSQLEQAVKPALILDRDLRELKGGARENRPLSINMTKAIEMAAQEAGVPLKDFDPPAWEKPEDLARRAGAFITRAIAQVVKEYREGRALPSPPPPSSSSRGSTRVLLVSHGGLLLQMFTKVFKASDLSRVLNASLTHVEVTVADGDEERSSATASPPPPSSPHEEVKEGGGGQLRLSFVMKVVNDVQHLIAIDLVTTRSTAL